MKKKAQTVEEMVMRSHYLNALDIESKAETPLSDMERQDFINTINELRSTIESLRLTIATLQRTIESLHDGERRYEKQIAELRQQCEYLESLNKRHCKNRFSGKTLSRKNRTENKKKGRDEQEPDYVDSSTHGDSDASDKGDTGTDAFHGSNASELDQTKVKSEGLNEARGCRGSYEKMDAAETIVLKSKVDGAPAGWKFLKFKDVDEYTKVSYVRKTTFKVAVFVDECGVYHEYYSPEDPEDERRPYVNVIPGTHCTPDLFSEITSDHIQLHIPIYREGIRHEIDKFKISKNTDRNWLKAGYRLFLPILDVIKKKLLRVKSILHIDETWTAVRIKLKGDGTKLGHYFKKYIWCLVNKAEGITYFFYDNDKNDSRGLRPIENFLGAFETGTIQSDAYVVYELLTNGNENLKHVLCWAHVRNRFEEAFLSSKDAIADWFVKTIAELYRIETECILARMTPDMIKERRNEKDVDDILKRLYRKASEYLDHKKKHYSKMTQDAMKYMMNGWKELIRYRDDGNYDIDNLVAERAIRPFTVHRKNAQSFGSEEGVVETCLFFTLCETCKNFSVNFKEYVAYAAKELISGNTDYESLAPWAIKLV